MPRLSTAEAARDWVATFGQPDFEELWPRLAPLCFNEYGWPVGIKHVEYFDVLDEPALAAETRDELTLIYVYLAASFFCLDHLYDGESQNDFEILASSLFISKALERLVVVHQADRQVLTEAMAEGSHLFAEYSRAMLMEREARSGLGDPTAQETPHIVGRSWLVVFMFKVIQRLKGRPVSPETEQLLEQIIFHLQLGDDWGDWRIDYRAKNWTPFLRRCFQKMGRRPLDEAELERFMYLSGAYEEEGQRVVEGLNAIAERLKTIYGPRGEGLISVVRRNQERAATVVENFHRVKLRLPPLPIPDSIQ